MKFSDEVKQLRIELEMSQETLAREIGVSKATISRWEADERKPQLATLGKFYNYCKKRKISFKD